MVDPSPLKTLSDLLRGAGAQPVISQARLSPSTIYDLRYRLTVNACAFTIHAKKDVSGLLRLHSARLKLLQFIAIRPWLLPVIQEWSASRRDLQRSLLVSQHLRRGFLGDELHDRVIEYLAACDVLLRAGTYLVEGKNLRDLTALHGAVVEKGLFATERAVLYDLSGVKVTQKMLEGW